MLDHVRRSDEVPIVAAGQKALHQERVQNRGARRRLQTEEPLSLRRRESEIRIAVPRANPSKDFFEWSQRKAVHKSHLSLGPADFELIENPGDTIRLPGQGDGTIAFDV